VQNNLLELWGLLHWLYPTVFTSASEQKFKDSFSVSTGSYDLPFLNTAKKLLSTIMIRRTKAAVEATVPPREELTVFIPLTEAQRFWYYRLLTRMDTLDLEQIFGETGVDEDQGRKEVKEGLKKMMESKDDKRLFPPLVAPLADDLISLGACTEYRKLLNLLIQLRQLCDQ
jgi:SWI/SNF-related matrix-associated actin-dependent regulator of chromatin subfamily A member 5